MPLLDLDRTPLHVLDEGSGDPVVLLHAFPFSSAMWSYQVEALSPHYRVIAPDLPGFGDSPPPPRPDGTSLAGWSDLLAALIDHLDLGPVHLVGLSMGGYLAMEFLRTRADAVRSLVLADTRPRADDGDVWQRRTEQQAALAAGDPLENLAKPMVDEMLSSASLARPELVEYVHQLMVANTREGWITALEAMKGRSDSLTTLRGLTIPALVVVGERDRMTPLADASLMQSQIDNAELVEIPDAGHLSAIENPTAFDEALLTFLDRVTGRRVGDDDLSGGVEATT